MIPITGNPVVDWIGSIGTIALAILAVWYAVRLADKKGRAALADGPTAVGPAAGVPFGRRENDPHIEVLRDKSADHDTRIAVLESDQDHIDESITRLDHTIIQHRDEQRDHNKTMYGKLDTILDRLPPPGASASSS